MQQNTPFYSNYLIQNTKGSNFNMKTMKKIFALTLALMLVFSLALTANAAAKTVEITNAQQGATYKIYNMLDVKSKTTDESGIVYEIAEGWDEFFKQDGVKEYFDIKEDGVIVAKDNFNDAAAATVAGLAATYASGHSGLKCTDVTATEGTTTVSLEDGYYLMTSTVGGENKKSTLVNINGASLTIREKNTPDGLPKVNKEVEELGADYKVGDIGNFTITVVCEEGKDSYTIHDLMQGLEVNGNITVTVPTGATYTIYNPSTTCEAGCSFEVVVNFGEGKSKAYDEIIITYQAKVTETGVETFSNKAWIDDVSSTVEEKTTKHTLKKTDGKNELSGAEFELYIAADNDMVKVNVIEVTVGGETYYRPAATDETPVTIKAGTALIKGLKTDGVYYVKETKAPDGYVPIDDYKQLDDAVVEIINVKGDELPETGGMGTTLFYTLGGLMVAAAAVLLITKKRMSAM